MVCDRWLVVAYRSAACALSTAVACALSATVASLGSVACALSITVACALSTTIDSLGSLSMFVDANRLSSALLSVFKALRSIGGKALDRSLVGNGRKVFRSV